MQAKILTRVALCAVFAALAGCNDSSNGATASAAASTGNSSSAGTLAGSTSTVTPFNSASTLIALSAFEYPVPAQAASAAVLVYRSGEATGVATVNYATADGTATAGTDYSAVSGSFTWVPGDTSGRVFYVPVTRGAAGKQFKVRLTSVSGDASFETPSAATVVVASASSGSSSGASSSTSSSSGASSSTSSSSGSPSSSSSSSGSSSSSSGSNSAAYYVAPNGNDGNAGSLDAPFLTPKKAQSAMRGSSTKATYLRAGTYNVTATLALTSADNGETWQYYPPDGVDSAVLNGGNSVSGGIIAIEGGSNITINGLKIENFVDYGIIGEGGPNTNWGTVAEDTGNTIENCDIGFNTTTSWQSGGISLSGPNSTIANNYVHDIGSQGIASYAYYAGQSINGTVIKNNVVLRAVQRMSDGGAIYTNMHSGIQTDYVTITNNYVADQGSANTWGVHGIYLDDLSSNVMVTGNVVAPPTAGTGTGSGSQYGTNAISAFLDNSGNHNTVSGNIVDLGSSGYVSTIVFYYDSAELHDVGMDGDTFTGNIVISNFTGGVKTNVSGVTGYAYFENTPAVGQDPKGFSYTIRSNAYRNYAGGPISSSGPVTSDSNPITEDPQISGWDYTIAGGSPVFNSPVNFAPIIGGWGPPGFVIPTAGSAPSAPH